jgi:uncharacterized protein YegJ (DUF2314 family)
VIRQRAVFAPGDLPALVAASDRARDTFGYCWRELTWDRRRAVAQVDLACVKVAAPEGEHPWLGELDFDGRTISGVLLNDPTSGSGFAVGDRREVGLDQVEDWLYATFGQAYGGHTVQVLRGRMGRLARWRHDRAWGLDFPAPDEVRLAPADDGEPGAEHPESVIWAAQLSQYPDVEVLVDGDDGLTALHREAMAGNRSLVRMLLEQGADPRRRTPQGDTAADLARRLGWADVVSLLESAAEEVP